MSETSEIVTPAMNAINKIPGVACIRVHSGRVKVARGWMKQNRKGSPDLLAVVNGRAVFMEAKKQGEKLTPDQEQEHERLRRAGATVVVIHSPDEAIAAVMGVRRWLT